MKEGRCMAKANIRKNILNRDSKRITIIQRISKTSVEYTWTGRINE